MACTSCIALLAAEASSAPAATGLATMSVGEPAEKATPAKNDAPPPQDWRAMGYLGGFGDVGRGDNAGGMTLGGTFQYRAGPLVGGALAEAGGEIFGYSYTGAAALGGVGLRPARQARIQFLGELGHHSYTGVGRDWLFGSDPGAKGSTPYAGGRMTLSYIFGKKRGHFELGAYTALQDDLSRKSVTYSYRATGDGWFEGGGVGDHVIGTTRLGVGLELGGSGDVF